MRNNPSEYIKNKKINNDIWGVYTGEDMVQSISSAGTARLQMPRTYQIIKELDIQKEGALLLDIGCGNGNERFASELAVFGVDYNGCDPFNKSQLENIDSISKCANGKSDIVTLNNVLNTIPEKKVWIDILNQAKDAANDDGLVMILIYEGEKLSSEKRIEKETGNKIDLFPIKTRDGWQNRMKAKEYMDTIKSVFKNSKLINTNSGKIILASNNLEMDLSKYKKQTKKNKKNI